MRKLVSGFLVIACTSATSIAWASDFNSQGQLVFAPNALYTQSFETGAAPAGGSAIITDPTALDGTHVLDLPAGAEAALSIALPARDGSVSVSLYLKGGSTFAMASASFTGPGVPYASALLFPTGRVTSDGWYEMKTSPISLPLHRGPAVVLELINASMQDAEIDGVELVPDGAFREARACSPPDASTCDPGDVCAIGYCIDGATYVPPMPRGADREDLPAWIGTAFYANFGGIGSRAASLSEALDALRAMPAARDANAYWMGLHAAVHRLHDSHSFPDFGFQASDILPVCFVSGDADLSHRQAPSDPVYPDVLVSNGLPGQMGGLAAGDRLVAVNGMHPVAFARSLVGLALSNVQETDPTEYEGAIQRLNYNVRQWATTITVIHCDPATSRCGSPHDIAVSSLPTVDFDDAPTCDNRPAYHLASGNPSSVTHDLDNDVFFGALADTAPSEALYGMIFDSLAPNPGPDPYQGPLQTIQQAARGVVIDRRTGDGGGFEYASEVSAPFLPTKTLTVTWGDEPFFANPHFSQADGLVEFDLLESVNAFTVGSDTPKAGLKAAVLTAFDVSADDFFAYGLRGGINGAANVRSFGTKSCGAFGQILPMSYAGGALWFSMGSDDSFTPTGASLDGTGAEPDEYIVPLQSDLLVGRDTAYERALAWLRCTGTDCDSKGGH